MELLKAGRAGRAGRAGWAEQAGRAGWIGAIALTFLLRAHAAPIDLAAPGRANATPSIAAAGDLVAIAWSASTPEGATDIYAAVSRDAGRTFGAPVRVNDVGGDARVSGEQPPRIAIVGGANAGRSSALEPASIAVVWTAKSGGGTTLKQARSTDGGRSFARTTLVPGANAGGNRGWQAIAVDGAGRVDVVWLDHRELANDASMATSHHEHGAANAKPDGVAMAQKSKLYFGSLDGTLAPRAITGGVCYCCKTALATGPNGALYAAWRHVYPGNFRDMAFTVSRDNGKTFAPPIRVSEDKWMLEGCPDDGPAMTVDGGSRVHIVWPTLLSESGGDPTIALFYASSADGRHFTVRERIPTEGMPHHPQIAMAADGSMTAAWDENMKGTRRVVIARAALESGGRTRFTRQVVSDGEPAVYPVVAASTSATIVAWTGGGAALSTIRVVRLPNPDSLRR